MYNRNIIILNKIVKRLPAKIKYITTIKNSPIPRNKIRIHLFFITATLPIRRLYGNNKIYGGSKRQQNYSVLANEVKN